MICDCRTGRRTGLLEADGDALTIDIAPTVASVGYH